MVGDHMENFIQNLSSSLHKGFIDRNYDKYGSHKPRLIVNNVKGNENVLNIVLEELAHCSTFIFIVAFITESGLATLKSHLLDLHLKRILRVNQLENRLLDYILTVDIFNEGIDIPSVKCL